MGRIRILDAQTVNEIAAGEVIERPASVVKELLENAIDSGAKRIQVRIDQGGAKRIEIIDDGEGMSRDDAALTIRQHATSKLNNIDDLSSLSTYGFRGEALASIASVSRITIRTHVRNESVGTLLVSEFGSEPVLSSIGTPIGTSVIVEGLFSNVPARRKNLASEKAELAHVHDIITRYAVAWPEVAFDLISNGSEMLSFRGPDRHSRLAELVGARAIKRIVDFSTAEDRIEITGALTKMDVTRSSSSSIYLYINKRPVSSPLLLSAIADGYGTRLMKGRYPIGYLMINIDPREIDVNVHPTKREVRFADPERVRELVMHVIDEAFKGTDLTPKLGDLMEYMKIGSAPGRIDTGAERQTTQSELETKSLAGGSSPPLVPLFQLFDTYIVARGSDAESVVILDQHAAAERITYEGILRSLEEKEKISQRLLSPKILDLSTAEMIVVEEYLEKFKALGFEIESFGGGSYRLVSVPVVLGADQGERSLKLVIDEISKSSRRRPVGEDFIWKVACHGSIRANESLSKQQMSALISDLFKTRNPNVCEHGRPTMISLKESDFKKLFKRQI